MEPAGLLAGRGRETENIDAEHRRPGAWHRRCGCVQSIGEGGKESVLASAARRVALPKPKLHILRGDSSGEGNLRKGEKVAVAVRAFLVFQILRGIDGHVGGRKRLRARTGSDRVAVAPRVVPDGQRIGQSLARDCGSGREIER